MWPYSKREKSKNNIFFEKTYEKGIFVKKFRVQSKKRKENIYISGHKCVKL